MGSSSTSATSRSETLQVTFLGTLEVTQDIGPLQALTGERRLEQEE